MGPDPGQTVDLREDSPCRCPGPEGGRRPAHQMARTAQSDSREIAAIGHRVVHGGSRYHQPELVTAELIDELRKISLYDPDHLPGEIELIEAFRDRDPDLPQVACFDTAFHHDMPRVARIVPIPRRYEAAGVRRYGFHGLSYAVSDGGTGPGRRPGGSPGPRHPGAPRRRREPGGGPGRGIPSTRPWASRRPPGWSWGRERAISIQAWSGSCRGPRG